MWFGQATEQVYNDMCDASCKQHASNVIQLPDFPEILKKTRRLFWTMKTYLMDNFLFYSEGSPTQEGWIEESKILPHGITSITDRSIITPELKEKILLIDSVSTYVFASLLTVCCLCEDLQDEEELLDYFEKRRAHTYSTHLSTLDSLALKDAIDLVANQPIYPKARENFKNCDIDIVQLSFVLSYYIFLEMFDDAGVALRYFDDYFSFVEGNMQHTMSKGRGNEEYNNQNYNLAVDIYTNALCGHKNHYSHVLYGNRAQALLKMGKYSEAELDCRAAIILSPLWSKGYYRLAQSLATQNKIHVAHLVADFGMRHCSNSTDLTVLKSHQLEICDVCYPGCVTEKIKQAKDFNEKEIRLKMTDAESFSDIPELIDSSDSSSESSDEHEIDEVDAPKSKGSDRMKEKNKPEENNNTKTITTEVKNELQVFSTLLKDGFIAMVQMNLPTIAKQNYFDALLQVKSGFQLESSDVIALKYAYGVSCVACNTVQDLRRAVEVFREIITDSPIFLPPASYKLASVFYKFNKFKEALSSVRVIPLEELSKFHCVLHWPGEKDVIKESKPEVLRELIKDLIYKCEHPPSPDAKCKRKGCPLSVAIYFSDPDFKGFASIECHEHCLLQYHISCWNHLKESYSKTDKEFLEFRCLTPDCDGVIVKVEKFGKTGTVEKLFETGNKKAKKNTKQKKTKFEKKFEIKELKKKKRQRSTSLCEVNNPDEDETAESPLLPMLNERTLSNEVIKTEPDITIPEKSNSAEALSLVDQTVADPKPFYIIKKENFEFKAPETKAPKHKERKKPKKSTLSFEQFCENYSEQDISKYNEQQLRLHKLQETRRVVEESAEFCNTEKFAAQSSLVSHDIAENQTRSPPVLPATKTFEVEKALKDYIYPRFEDILHARNTLDLSDPIVTKELGNIPEEWRKIIEDSGGFERFIQQDTKFAVVGEKLCFFSEMLNLYNASKVEELDSFSLLHGDEEQVIRARRNTESDLCLEEKQSLLNPNALAYSPCSSSSSLSSKHATCISNVNDNIVYKQGVDFSDVTDVKTEDKSLLDCLTSLRQPLSSYSAPMMSEGPTLVTKTDLKPKMTNMSKGDDGFVADEFVRSVQKLRLRLNAGEFTSDFLDSVCDLAGMLYKAQDINKVMDCLQNSEVNLANMKQDKFVQACPVQVKFMTRGINTDPHDMAIMIDTIEKLLREKEMLTKRKETLEMQLTQSLDSVAQLQNKFSAELPALERSLAESEISRQDECKLLKSKILALEKDVKQWRQRHDLTVEKEKEIKKENTKLQFKLNNYNTKISELNRTCEDYAEKMANQSKVVETCEKIVHQNNLQMEQNKLQTNEASKRAKDAEVALLKFKRETYMQKFDQILLEGNRKIEELKTTLERCDPYKSMPPNMFAPLTKFLEKLKECSNEIHNLRITTVKLGDDLIKRAEAGTPLSQLQEYNFPKLPALPDVMKELSSIPPPANFPAQANPPNIVLPIGARPPLLALSPSQVNFSPWNVATAYNNVRMPNPPPQGLNKMPGIDNFAINRPPNFNSPPLNPSVSAHKPVGASNFPPGMATVGDKLPRKNTQNKVPPKSQIDAAENRKNTAEKLSFSLSVNEGSSSKGSFESLANAAAHATNDTDEVSSTSSFQSSLKSRTATPVSNSSQRDVPSSSDVSNLSQLPSSTLELGYSSANDRVRRAKPQPSKSCALQKTTQKKGSYAKILDRLKVKFPGLSDAKLLGYLKQFRDITGQLTGMSIDSIIAGISELINRNNRPPVNYPAAIPQPKAIVNKAIASLPVHQEPPKAPPNENPWGKPVDSTNASGWAGDDCVKGCIICLEDDVPYEQFIRMECGHRFHRLCIKQWLDKMSTCPICRVHLLLPEDYPTLG